MIKILFFIPGLSEGGAEKVLRNLVNHMDQSKFDITVQTIDWEDPKKYFVPGIRYKAVNRCKTKWGRKLFSYWFRLCLEGKLAYQFFVKEDYDIEAAYLETAATKLLAQSDNERAVKLAWVHCDLSQKEGMEVLKAKGQKQYEQYDKIVCVSEDVRTGFWKLYGNKLKTTILPNVIDEEEILRKAALQETTPPKGGEKELLALGRLTPQKNFSYLVDTCARLYKEGFSFSLNILGEGPERENLEKQIKGLGLENRIKLRGFISNPYPWMKRADMIVCSSKYEGISTVVQEAFFLGKPVVTTPCTGMRELLGDSEYGLIVEDSKDGLFLGLKEMLEHPEQLEAYEKAAEKRGKMFQKQRVIQETEEFLLWEWRKKKQKRNGNFL